MDKTTIELERTKNHWSNYGVILDKWTNNDSSLVLDAVLEWSKTNPEANIYRHKIRVVEENLAETPVVVKTEQSKIGVRYCDRVVYLDIYYQ